jgi:ornithine cyclodeaminase/alanine dehydrogenase-like protein (mu-crystallin family)
MIRRCWDGEKGKRTALVRELSLFLTEEHIQQRLRYRDLIPSLKQALIDYSAGRVVQPLRTVLSIPQHEGWFAVMPAVLGDVMGAKMVSVFPLNAGAGLPTHLALIALFRSSTGELLAVMDGRLITEMRTAAVSAIATDLLASPDAHVLTVMGSGVQARAHVEALRMVRPFDEIRVWSRNQENARRFAEEVNGRAMTAEEAVRGADVIVTVTNSPDAVLFGDWIDDGAHVNAVGAVGAARRELDDAAMKGFIVVESRESTAHEAGDVILSGAKVDAELGELLAAGDFARTGRTVFKSVGIAVEDLAAAMLVMGTISGTRLSKG